MRLRFIALALAAVGSLAVADRASAQVVDFYTPTYYITPYNPLVRTYSAAVYHSNYSFPRVVPTYVVPTYSTVAGMTYVRAPGSATTRGAMGVGGTTYVPGGSTYTGYTGSGVIQVGATTYAPATIYPATYTYSSRTDYSTSGYSPYYTSYPYTWSYSSPTSSIGYTSGWNPGWGYGYGSWGPYYTGWGGFGINFGRGWGW